MAAHTRMPDTRDVWIARLYFFIYIGGTGFIRPFLSLFYRGEGLSGTEIGLVGTIGALATLIAAPLWGRWADTLAHPRRLMQAGLVGSAAAMLVLSQQTQFRGIAIAIIFYSLLGASLLPLSDALALGVTQNKRYGSIRIGGSLGWAVTVVIAGWLIEQTGIFSAFLGFGISLGLAAVLLILLPPGTVRQGRHDSAPSGLTWHNTQQMLRSRSMLVLTIALISLGLFVAGLFNFEPIFLVELGAGETLIGVAGTIGALMEIPAMLLADRIIHRIGARRLFLLSMLLDMLRMIVILLFPAVLPIILTRLIGGLAFGFRQVALIVYIHNNAPAGQETMALALYSITLPGLVLMIGDPLGGALYDLVGAYWLYAVALGGFFLAWMVMRFAAQQQS